MLSRSVNLALVAVISAVGIACSPRCEPGFVRQGDICVAFDIELDGGAVDSSVRDGSAPDVGFVDAGPRPDSGGDTSPGDPGLTLIRGAAVLPMVDQQVIQDGEVLVEGGRIACIGPRGRCTDLAARATIVETGGIVMPGLVDAHNHVAYNFLPEWAPPRVFDDSGQWRSNSDYKDFVSPYSQNKGDRDNFCAMVQWGEVMALANGTTTIIGAPQPRTCFRWLVRNAELSTGYNGFDADRVRTNTLGIDTVSMDDAASIAEEMESGELAAYVVHLAEGISTRAREEFLEMRALGLVREQAVLIHATGLEPSDFDEVAAVGAKVVWSPSSNMALYEQTTNVQAALQAGVSVSIAPDWTPSGTDNVLDELRFAEQLVDTTWPGLLSPPDYVAMVTRIPAMQLGVPDQIGTLQVGLYGDILVLDGDPMVPFRSVIDATPDDIRLVFVGGVPSYGDPALLSAMPDTPVTCADVDACGTTRAACWEETPEGPVTLEGIRAAITAFFSPGPEPLVDCR